MRKKYAAGYFMALIDLEEIIQRYRADENFALAMLSGMVKAQLEIRLEQRKNDNADV